MRIQSNYIDCCIQFYIRERSHITSAAEGGGGCQMLTTAGVGGGGHRDADVSKNFSNFHNFRAVLDKPL